MVSGGGTRMFVRRRVCSAWPAALAGRGPSPSDGPTPSAAKARPRWGELEREGLPSPSKRRARVAFGFRLRAPRALQSDRRLRYVECLATPNGPGSGDALRPRHLALGGGPVPSARRFLLTRVDGLRPSAPCDFGPA